MIKEALHINQTKPNLNGQQKNHLALTLQFAPLLCFFLSLFISLFYFLFFSIFMSLFIFLFFNFFFYLLFPLCLTLIIGIFYCLNEISLLLFLITTPMVLHLYLSCIIFHLSNTSYWHLSNTSYWHLSLSQLQLAITSSHYSTPCKYTL